MTHRPEYVGYIAMSLDGFIATPDGGVEWLTPFNEAIAADGGDGGYGDFITDVDALMVGHATYIQVLGWGWPYEERPAYVLTHRLDFKGDHIAASGPVDSLKEAIEAADHRRIWIMGGGQTQRAALDAGMFDRITVFLMPTLLGKGLPCFAAGIQHNLTLSASTQMPGGIMKLDYTFKD
ncbi:MAG: dihydrofolate reductase [Shimia sp.]|nr:dihydrofolate reductase [Shimia sp.]